MADTFSKKEFSKKKNKKHQDKIQRREDRKTNNNKNKSLDDMLVYVDINGNFTSVPTHLQNREEDLVKENKLVRESSDDQETIFTGIVTFFSEKGFGFITEDKTGNNIFFHQAQLAQPVSKNDKVSYKKESSFKGDRAIDITK